MAGARPLMDLGELVDAGRAAGRLRFTDDPAEAADDIDVQLIQAEDITRAPGDLVDELAPEHSLWQAFKVRVIDDRRHELAIRVFVGKRRRCWLERCPHFCEAGVPKAVCSLFWGREFPDGAPVMKITRKRRLPHHFGRQGVRLVQSGAAAALGDASDTMMAHPLALQLRNLQTLIEISDYHCPFCRRSAQQTFPQIVSEYVKSGKAQYAFIEIDNTMAHAFHPLNGAVMLVLAFWLTQRGFALVRDTDVANERMAS